MHYFINKNNICIFSSQRQILIIFTAYTVQLCQIESAVLVSLLGWLGYNVGLACSPTKYRYNIIDLIAAASEGQKVFYKNRFQILQNNFFVFKVQNYFYSFSPRFQYENKKFRFHQNFSSFSNVKKRFFPFSSGFQYENEHFFVFTKI